MILAFDVEAGAFARSMTAIFSLVLGRVADLIFPAVGPSEGLAQALSKAKRSTGTIFFIHNPQHRISCTQE
jgi:hypothetical protein